jgi:hypothetical protein
MSLSSQPVIVGCMLQIKASNVPPVDPCSVAQAA